VRRAFWTLFIGLMTAIHVDLSCPSVAEADGRQVLTIVAPAAPGGGWDHTARVMQQTLTALEAGASVQVENVAGAAGTIGLARFVSAERGNPDALMITGLVMVSAIVTNHAPVSLAETTPIARLTGEYEVIVVPAESKWRSLGELVDAFTRAPARISWGGGSAGGTDDLLVRMIANSVGVPARQANYIAFPGGGAALAALLGGQVTAGVSGYSEFAGQIAAGTLRLLAVSSPSRVAHIDAPTLREQGIALDLANWRGVVAPPGLTETERARLTARVARMAGSAEWKAVLAQTGWEDLFLSGAPFRQFLLAEQQRIEQVLRTLATAHAPAASGGLPRSLRLTPQTLPIVAMIGALCLIAVVVARSRGAATGHGDIRRPAVLVAALLAHAIVMPLIGFIPASATLFVITARLMGSRRLAFDAAIGVAAAAALFFVFTRGLGLTL
jgi:putative tricarboxylic transport membrane protein